MPTKGNQINALAPGKVDHLRPPRRHRRASRELPADRLILLGCKPAGIGKGIDRIDRFVAPDGFDTRKAQRKSAGVTCAWLDRVKGHFQNNIRFHFPITPPVEDGVAFEMFG